MFKKWTSLVSVVFLLGLALSVPAGAEQFLVEHFNYANGADLNGQVAGQGAWVTDGTNYMVLNDDGLGDGGTSSLQYPGLTDSQGGRLIPAGDCDYILTTPVVGEGSVVYLSFLLKPTAVLSGYFTMFATSGSVQGALGRLRGQDSGGQTELGVSIRGNSFSGWSGKTVAVGETALVVIKLTMVPGPDNDIVELWVNPTVGAPEPPADAASSPDPGNDLNPETGILGFRSRDSGAGESKEVDEIRFGTTWDDVVGSVGGAEAASAPNPEDEMTDVPRDVVLSWTPGESAAPTNGHKVHFGESFDDVNDAVGGLAQTATSYTPAQRLDFGKTYYWRVDEVEADGTTIHKGDVWSFTVEPFAYSIPGAAITATASSVHEADAIPENTVDGSGLDSDDLHSTDESHMWLSNEAGPEPAWIQYKFDKSYKLHQMLVWNHNSSFESSIGFGVKEAIIEYSSDGSEWTRLGDTHEFTQAPGEAGYAHDTVIDFGGVGAKYVKITINSNWGSHLTQYGLSEVRFLYIPVQAREPSPDSGATDVALDLSLGWRPGRQADRHDVYFGTSRKDVAKGTAEVTTVTETSYGPLALDLGDTYYWRVDEVNDAETPDVWEGEVWNFTTQEYFVVDDFEIYDANDNQIWFAWHDGYGYADPAHPPAYAGNGTGAAVGDETSGSYTEETIVYGGDRSMPYTYNNSGSTGKLNYSEAAMTLTSGRDWTRRSVKALSLWFRGHPMSVSSFEEAPAGTYTMTARSVGNISGESDEFHFAYQVLNGAGSITAKVDWVNDADDNAQAGVMIRDTLEADSAHVTVLLETNDIAADWDLRYRRRETAAGDSSTERVDGIMAPQWLRVSRDMGGNVTASYSADGTTWTDLGTGEVIPMDTPMYIGLLVASENIGVTCTAQFSDVQITGGGGQWMNQDVGISSNEPEPMYVAVANSNGTTGVVYHDDPAATQIGTWTEWNIDLGEFADQGVNLTDVNSLAIGFGDRDNPQAGNSGKMYFDDIRLYPSRCIPSVLKPACDFSDNCVVEMADLELMAADWLQSDSVVSTAAPDSTGLVLHYKFDGNANDSSGNNHHGIEVAGPTYVSGKFGQAIHLDGFDDYVAIPAGVNYTAADYPEVTVAAWVRTTEEGCIVSFDRSENFRLEVGGQYAGEGLAGWEVWTSDGQMDTDQAANYPANTGRIDDGQWHHVAGVFDNGTMTIYIDGNPREPHSLGTTFGRGRYTRYGFIGSGSEASYPPPTGRANGPYLEADLDDIRIYDRALTPAEIAYLADETPEDGELYIAVQSVADLYDEEPQGSKAINFKDFAVLTESWLDELLWPQP